MYDDIYLHKVVQNFKENFSHASNRIISLKLPSDVFCFIYLINTTDIQVLTLFLSLFIYGTEG